MGSPEIYDHISWVDLSKNQKIINKRKMNTQEFLEEEKFDSNPKNTKLSIEERKRVFNRFYMKKDYVCLERINRRIVNILDGLQLHIGVFNSMEQKEIVQFIYDLQNRGRNNELGVSYKRISVTFRKIDKAKQPHNFKFDSDFQNIKSSDFSDASESYHTKKGRPYRMTISNHFSFYNGSISTYIF
ncbi:hypothetical protein IEQ34_000542 [Dendrobium chrysotoxum]|uniref:Uncharacterized protein n=1 Tax=Dendrobium chrysotoxum TaxID=161865 RepID=A0AAV7HAJ6_DENCH|nr:hypothetical protein IEQ34_000542 [Dendrobium chrysotoxum]